MTEDTASDEAVWKKLQNGLWARVRVDRYGDWSGSVWRSPDDADRGEMPVKTYASWDNQGSCISGDAEWKMELC